MNGSIPLGTDDMVSVTSLVLGAFILFFGLGSMPIKDWFYLSEPLVATIFGIIIGPVGLNLIELPSFNDSQHFILQFARITIAITIMTAAVTVSKGFIVKELRSLVIILLPVMLIKWLLSAGFIYCLLPINFVESLLIAACVTPTDPVLSSSVVKGSFAKKYVPEYIRDFLSVESCVNDGLGYPYVLLPILLLKYPDAGESWSEWICIVLLYQIMVGTIVGILLGYAARKLLHYSDQRRLIEREALIVFACAFAIFTMGLLFVIGCADLFGVFIACTAFSWDDWFANETGDAHLQDILDLVLNLCFFTYFGMIIPWSEFATVFELSSVWILVGLTAIILLFRRVPVVLSLYWTMPVLKNWREALFVGWFGPIGASAIFYSVLIPEELRDISSYDGAVSSNIFPVISFIVLSSIIIHGITVPIFKLSTSQLAHNIAHSPAITQLIRRLPRMHGDRELVIHHTKDATTIAISRTNSRAPGELANPLGLRLEHTTSIPEEPSLPKSNTLDGTSASGRKSFATLRRHSFSSSLSRKAKFLPAEAEGCITYVHSVDEHGRHQSTLVEDNITGYPLGSEPTSITIDRRSSPEMASPSRRNSTTARYPPTTLPRRSMSPTGIRLDRPTQSLGVLERGKGTNK